MVQAPTIQAPEISELIIIQRNTLVPIRNPVFTSKLPSTAILGAERYLDNPFLLKRAEMIILCESGGRHEVWGKAGEYGIAQFKKETFYWMAKLAKLENPDWKDRDQQLYLLLWALDKGIAKYHWTCF